MAEAEACQPGQKELFKKIVLPENCNRDMVLGQVVEAMNNLSKCNKEDHDKIFARLDEGDRLLFVLKASKCSLGWLNRNGFLKWGLLASLFTALGWLFGIGKL